MINQTIDGVPRELLERLVSQELGMSAKKDRAEAAHELRALLDANPEENTPCPQCGGSLRTWGCTCDPRWPSYKADSKQPAAQPQDGPLSELEVLRAAVKELEAMRDARVDAKLAQGEPVAWYTDDHLTDKSATTYDRAVMERWKAKDWPVNQLYAEQPAPVAVTLNQVLAAYDYANYHPHKYLRGTTNWCAAVAYKLNACLDELKRLNTKE